MSEAAAAADDRLDGVRADLAGKPDGVLETVAERHDVPLQAVLDCLPAPRVPGERFAEIWRELTAWGEVMFLVHTRDGVFECKTRLPPGEAGRGYFNIHGPDSPLGGHLRADRCRWIYFVDRPFFGKRSCSLQFVSVDGDAMFKVFVARAAGRSLDPRQLALFEDLRAKLAAA
ncbi:MAG TPA: heme utilization cystosolic carrier protein HutX [Methyloceanibacter sp.]|jgi:putative heme utilization carrier protein HutX|nr:heme utilization cystosolic carrier protein HutX [Methyloceanibacter sp.]